MAQDGDDMMARSSRRRRLNPVETDTVDEVDSRPQEEAQLSRWQTHLPERELWVAVMSKLRPPCKGFVDSSGKSRLVCKAWAEAWQPADLTMLYPRPQKFLQPGVFPSDWAERLPKLTSLDLSKSILDFTDTVTLANDAQLFPALQHLKCLKKLSLSNCQAVTGNVLTAIQHMTGLTSLDISDCAPLPLPEMEQMLSSLTGLTHLDISSIGCDGDELAEFLPRSTSLTSLKLSNLANVKNSDWWLVDPLVLDAALQPLTRLTRLDLSFNFIRDDALRGLRHLENLTYLDVSYCDFLTGTGLTALQPLSQLCCLKFVSTQYITLDAAQALGTLTSITCLDISECRDMGADKLQAMRRMTKLRRLDLSGCKGLCGEALAQLRPLTSLMELNLSRLGEPLEEDSLTALQPLTSLQHLNLSHCPGLSDQSLSALWPLTGLTALDLGDNPWLTDHGLEVLQPLTSLMELELDMCPSLSDTAREDALQRRYWPIKNEFRYKDCVCKAPSTDAV